MSEYWWSCTMQNRVDGCRHFSSDIVRLIGNAEHETLTYPRGICLQLAEILQASTTIYPKSHQKLGEWDVGWLERDVGRQT